MSTVPQLRDDDTVRKTLGEWLTERIPNASDVKVSRLGRPQGAGGSNETLLAKPLGPRKGNRTAQNWSCG
jgi:hypothetical protein